MPEKRPVVVLNVMPVGSVPAALYVAAGSPLVVTAKLAGVPTVKVAALALVTIGTSPTVSLSTWLVEPRTLLAPRLMV